MPIPKRNIGEGRDEYIGRCISNLSDEYPQDQATAICYNQLSKFNMAEEVPAVDPKEIAACMLELRGINPSYAGAVAYKICYDRLTVGKAQSIAEDKGIIDPTEL
jgi:hypothetical protein